MVVEMGEEIRDLADGLPGAGDFVVVLGKWAGEAATFRPQGILDQLQLLRIKVEFRIIAHRVRPFLKGRKESRRFHPRQFPMTG